MRFPFGLAGQSSFASLPYITGYSFWVHSPFWVYIPLGLLPFTHSCLARELNQDRQPIVRTRLLTATNLASFFGEKLNGSTCSHFSLYSLNLERISFYAICSTVTVSTLRHPMRALAPLAYALRANHREEHLSSDPQESFESSESSEESASSREEPILRIFPYGGYFRTTDFSVPLKVCLLKQSKQPQSLFALVLLSEHLRLPSLLVFPMPFAFGRLLFHALGFLGPSTTQLITPCWGMDTGLTPMEPLLAL